LAQAASQQPGRGQLKVTEVFYSLQGEALFSGWPTVFIRLTGCPLRCGYCDTAYAFHGGEWCDIDALVDQVGKHGVQHVCVTGGEPLAQKRCAQLLTALCDAGYNVSLETSGAMNISAVDARVHRVVDLKTPGSGEVARNLWRNLEALAPQDCVKFVICDRPDYEWARGVLEEWGLAHRCAVFFSPSFGQVTGDDLAAWILADHLPVRLQLQLHKLLWGDEPGR
jgi:7-carboxy-7-deazaguanine synthase